MFNVVLLLLTFENNETIIYGVSGMREYSRNIIQWNKRIQKAWNWPNGVYLNYKIYEILHSHEQFQFELFLLEYVIMLILK